MEDKNEGSCLACVSPCATCEGSPKYCTSCVDGYTRRKWKCQNNLFVGFRFTLDDTVENILADIDTIVDALLQILNMNSTDIEAITFESIEAGSTLVSGSS